MSHLLVTSALRCWLIGEETSRMGNQDRIFNNAWQQYKAAIARVVQSYEAIPALQEELQQDIAFAVWRSLPNFNQKSSLKTYILSIAHNRAISHVAKYAREGSSLSSEDVVLAGDGSPLQDYETGQKHSRLIAGLQRLPIGQRQILGLALEGLSYDEIAAALGITVNNVGVRLNRAKKALKDVVET